MSGGKSTHKAWLGDSVSPLESKVPSHQGLVKSPHLQNLWVVEGGDQDDHSLWSSYPGRGRGEGGREGNGHVRFCLPSKNVNRILGSPHVLGEGKDEPKHSQLAKRRRHFLTSPSTINLL